LVDEDVGAFGVIAVAGNSRGNYALVVELEPLILNADFGVVVAAVESAMMMDDAHESVLH
jgi:hypothetical protein